MRQVVFFGVAPDEHPAIEAARFPDAERHHVFASLTAASSWQAGGAEAISMVIHSPITADLPAHAWRTP